MINLTGLHNHTINQLDIIHGAGVCEDLDTGPAILHVCQGAKMLEGKTILAPVQMEANGCIIHDRIMGLNSGEQPYIQTPEGLRIPMYTYQGLMYINVRPVREKKN